jgi:hypothetical protein
LRVGRHVDALIGEVDLQVEQESEDCIGRRSHKTVSDLCEKTSPHEQIILTFLVRETVQWTGETSKTGTTRPD